MAGIKGTPLAVDTSKKEKPTQADLECHRSLDAFCSWIEQFAEVNTGHFVSEGAAADFARQAANYVRLGGYVGEVPPESTQ